jgi:sulfatase maturation enzyme AslB (radical SAM superfamily)
MEFALERAEASPTAPAGSRDYPRQPLHHLDALWLQVAGSRCNLSCHHCLVSSGPNADRHAAMSRDEVARRVAEGVALGAREFYFTGGEPFLHAELEAILADTLGFGACTVLTNGTLLTSARIEKLRALAASSRYSLEIRVSFDGEGDAGHDEIRGFGSFARALDGLRRLADAGLLPIATITATDDRDPLDFREAWVARLREAGIARPRVKVIPLFRLGREADRTRGYDPVESLAGLDGFDEHRLQCGTSRAVTSRGVFVCPLLVDDDRARMSDRLVDAMGPFELRHGACTTCYATGMTCGNG